MTRRLLLVLFAALCIGCHSHAADQPTTLRVYFGTYTGKESKGIYACELDLASGKTTEPRLAATTTNPSFLAIHPNRKFLYAVGEVGEFNGQKTGMVTAFAIDAATGDLKQLNAQSTKGAGPCHVVVNPAGTHVFVANYGGGSCAALPIKDDGSLGEATGFVQHKGASVSKSRQEAPHAHSINLDPSGIFAFCADLGLDQVLIYKFDQARGTLTPNDPPAGLVAPGSGPRHFAFHPTGRFAYVINEMTCTVTAFSYDPAAGRLTEIQTIPTVPSVEKGYSTAEVQVHPSGRFLYGSNRGHDTLAIFSIDQATGKLTLVGHQSTGGKTPRNFGIDPTGQYVLAANQGSGTVLVFRVDQATGKLTQVGEPLRVPTPVCVKFVGL
jgi:6-phosphogluconolactonase